MIVELGAVFGTCQQSCIWRQVVPGGRHRLQLIANKIDNQMQLKKNVQKNGSLREFL
jgi:predicted NAD/FAD-binding protein